MKRPGRCRPPGPPGPPAPRIDLLTEKLVFPSRKTPPSFLPTPPSLSLNTAVRPVFSSSPISPRFSPRSPFQHREQNQQHTPSRHQARPQTSDDGGRRRRYYAQEEAAFSADEVARKEGETERILLPPATEIGAQIKTDGDEATMYQSMQPPGVPQPSTRFPSPPRQSPGPVREAFAFLSRGRKKSLASESPRSTLSKRSRTFPTSSTSTSTEIDASDFPQSPATKSVSEMPAISAEARNPAAKVSGLVLAASSCRRIFSG